MPKISQLEKSEKESAKKIEEQNSEITKVKNEVEKVNQDLNCALKKISLFEKSDKDALKKLKEQNSKISKLENSEKEADKKIKELTMVKNELERVNCVKENISKGEKISKLRNAKAAARNLDQRSQSFTSLMAY